MKPGVAKEADVPLGRSAPQPQALRPLSRWGRCLLQHRYVLRQGGCGDNSESASRDLILVECLALGLLPLPIHVLRNGAAMLRRC